MHERHRRSAKRIFHKWSKDSVCYHGVNRGRENQQILPVVIRYISIVPDARTKHVKTDKIMLSKFVRPIRWPLFIDVTSAAAGSMGACWGARLIGDRSGEYNYGS